MARKVSRNAHTGQFVAKATARRNPKTTTTAEAVGRGTANRRTVHRSTISGEFVTSATARRHPSATITQRV
mgnify:CR=1 FL=1